jgi:hypothetical protein
MKKILISYSGGFRTFLDIFDHNHKLFLSKGYEPKYLISTWDLPYRVEKINDPWHLKAEIFPTNFTLIDQQFIENNLPQIKKDIVHLEFQTHEDIKEKNIHNLHYQYFKLKRTKSLIIENNLTNYDLFLRIRMDMKIYDFPSYDLFNEDIKINLYTWYMYQFNFIDMNEMIWSTKNIDTFLKTLDIIDYFKKLDFKNIEYYGERITYNFFKSINLNNLSTFNYNYKILR